MRQIKGKKRRCVLILLMIFVLMISLIDFFVLVAYAAPGYDAGEPMLGKNR